MDFYDRWILFLSIQAIVYFCAAALLIAAVIIGPNPFP